MGFTPYAKTKLTIGVGCVAKTLGMEARKLGLKKILIVTDQGVRKAGLADKVKEPLDKEKIEVSIYDQVQPEPTLESFYTVAEAVRQANFDGVVGVGGGSSMDTAKAAAVFATNPGEPKNYVGLARVKMKPAPLITIPTTSGTGSEIDYVAIVVVDNAKLAIMDQKMLPEVALVDPMMTVSSPPKLTACCGMDALAHNVTAIMSVSSNIITDTLAMEGVRLVAGNLRKATYQGQDLQARYNMAIASTIGGMTNNVTSVSLDHALASTLGYGGFHLPHGLTCTLALPYAMDYNIPVIMDKLALVGEALGVNPAGISRREVAVAGIKAVIQLTEDLELPTRLKDVDVPKDALPKLADALVTGKSGQLYQMGLSPRPVTKDSAVGIYERMWEGKIVG
jgi:alcohol dehydrogenase